MQSSTKVQTNFKYNLNELQKNLLLIIKKKSKTSISRVAHEIIKFGSFPKHILYILLGTKTFQLVYFTITVSPVSHKILTVW